MFIKCVNKKILNNFFNLVQPTQVDSLGLGVAKRMDMDLNPNGWIKKIPLIH